MPYTLYPKRLKIEIILEKKFKKKFVQDTGD